MTVSAMLFDKDGTLFDFAATWNAWAAGNIEAMAAGDTALAQALAEAVDFDLDARSFRPQSALIAGTNREAAEAVATVLTDRSVESIEEELMVSAAAAPLVPAVPLAPFLDALRDRGMPLGVMTNDTEYGARAHLQSAGVVDRFAFIAGFDSGFGAKPAPDPLLAFCAHTGARPNTTAMVGDSTHDLIAGRAAGMVTIGVLTGMASPDDLRPHADVVLPDIGVIPAWLDGHHGGV